MVAQMDIYAYFKNSIATKWARENPELTEIEASYFNKERAGKYFTYSNSDKRVQYTFCLG